MIDEDMAHFARMGWDGMRLTFWGDWESADSDGNLIANDHLDLLDYLIARARERGIYMLFSPIQLYGAELAGRAAGHHGRRASAGYFGKRRMGTDPAAIAAQVELPAADPEPREPLHGRGTQGRAGHPLHRDWSTSPGITPRTSQGSVRYINALMDAVRSTGCTQADLLQRQPGLPRSARRSGSRRPRALTFGWYPTGLNSGHELQGNYLRSVDAYSRHAAPGAGPPAAHRLRVRRPRPAHRHHVPGDGADIPLGGHPVRRDVRLRHAGHRLAQPRAGRPTT